MSLYEVSNNNEFALSSEIIYSAWKTMLMFYNYLNITLTLTEQLLNSSSCLQGVKPKRVSNLHIYSTFYKNILIH